MGVPIIQAHSLVLPQFYTLDTDTEAIDDLVVHVSREFYIADIHEKKAHIVVVENVVAGVPGNLWFWIELSPVPSTVSAAYWAAIGGGGGAVIPVAPMILIGTGVDGASQTAFAAWVVHSEYARVIIQTPVAAALPGAFWQVQVIISGKTP